MLKCVKNYYKISDAKKISGVYFYRTVLFDTKPVEMKYLIFMQLYFDEKLHERGLKQTLI